MMLRVMIADDEPLARARMRRLLGEESDVEIVAECGNGIAAAEAIRRHRPDVVFLDIEMPELDGFEVLREVGDATPPAVVFVTAYDRHAIRAFEAEALDYVLKPVSSARIRRALERVRAAARTSDIDEKLGTILQRLHADRETVDRFPVRTKGKITFVRVADISYIEAAGNYARLHVGKESHLIRETLADVEAKLTAQRFVRIHRSAIVNVERVRELRPWFGGDYVVVMADGKELTLSRTYRARAGEILGI